VGSPGRTAALDIYRDLGDPLSQANGRNELADVRRLTGDLPAAAQALEYAITVYHDVGDRFYEAEAHNKRGILHRVSGDLEQAGECHQRALGLARVIASPWHEALALAGLGRCALGEGRTADGADQLRQALEIFHRFGVPEAAKVAAELDALP
jgi:tetratricopeptide (TPR) repeat protein